MPVTVGYDSTTGAFSARFTPLLSGEYTLTLALHGQAVGLPITVTAVPCMEGTIPNTDPATASAEPCIACEGDKTALPGDLACIRCKSLLYMTMDGVCEGCPIGATCATGSTVETLELLPGYWRLTNQTTHVRRCDWATEEEKTPCAGGSVGALCVDEGGLHGPLCSLCPEPHGTSLGSWYKQSAGRCEECPPPSSSIVAIFMVLLAIALLLALLAYIYHHPIDSLTFINTGLHVTVRFVERLGLWPKFKQLISFFQVLYSLSSVYRTTLPPQFYDAFEWISWITFDLLDIYPAACLGPFRSRLLVNTVGPLVLIAVVIAACSAAGAILGLVTAKMTWRDGAAVGGAVSVVIVWVLVPPVSKTVFEVYDCEYFGVSDVVGNASSSDAHDYAHFLHADMRISCSSDDYGSLWASQLLGLSSSGPSRCRFSSPPCSSARTRARRRARARCSRAPPDDSCASTTAFRTTGK